MSASVAGLSPGTAAGTMATCSPSRPCPSPATSQSSKASWGASTPQVRAAAAFGSASAPRTPGPVRSTSSQAHLSSRSAGRPTPHGCHAHEVQGRSRQLRQPSQTGHKPEVSGDAGGGDAAEDVFSGIEAAQALKWQAGSRILVHVTDAPCHGSEFHTMVRLRALPAAARHARREAASVPAVRRWHSSRRQLQCCGAPAVRRWHCRRQQLQHWGAHGPL